MSSKGDDGHRLWYPRLGGAREEQKTLEIEELDLVAIFLSWLCLCCGRQARCGGSDKARPDGDGFISLHSFRGPSIFLCKCVQGPRHLLEFAQVE